MLEPKFLDDVLVIVEVSSVAGADQVAAVDACHAVWQRDAVIGETGLDEELPDPGLDVAPFVPRDCGVAPVRAAVEIDDHLIRLCLVP